MRDFPRNKRNKNNNASTSIFVGSVLLAESKWNLENILAGLEKEWDIKLSSQDNNVDESGTTFSKNIRGMSLTISLMETPVEEEEIERFAEANYMWEDAVNVAKEHKAHLAISVSGGRDSLKAGELFVKVVSVASNSEYAMGVYTDGVVFEPEFYRNFAQDIKDGELPIINWVWFGIYKDDKKVGMYTYGLKKFGKSEIECYVDVENNPDLNDIRDFLITVTEYVLEDNIEFKDGETIGFTDEQELDIYKNEGIALRGNTIKIEYPMD